MNNPQNVAIVLLTVTAAILAGMLLGVWQDQSAQAAYPSVSKGDYIMVPYTWASSLDFLVVIDVSAQKMKLYTPNKTTKVLDISKDIDLERVFAD